MHGDRLQRPRHARKSLSTLFGFDGRKVLEGLGLVGSSDKLDIAELAILIINTTTANAIHINEMNINAARERDERQNNITREQNFIQNKVAQETLRSQQFTNGLAIVVLLGADNLRWL
jgi:hypothetical protein